MAATIIYLHGYKRNGEFSTAKADMIRAAHPDTNVIAPDLDHDHPQSIITQVGNIIRGVKEFPLVLVGTSMGGFWANYFAQKFDIPAILVNPAMNPSLTLKKYNVPEKAIAQYEKLEKAALTDKNEGLLKVYLAMDDDVIDPNHTIKVLPYAEKVIYANGGHRFMEQFGDVITALK